MTTIGWLDDPAVDLAVLGGKGAGLATLHRGGFRIPPGFCLLAPAYHRFVEANHLADVVAALLATPSLHDPKVAREACAGVSAALADATLPPEVRSAVAVSFRRLQEFRPGLACAVRSSALSEDASGASSAGLYETYLNLREEPAVVDAILRCYGSLWTPRAVQYRSFKKIDSAREAMAVVVMEMIQSEVAGVAFTVNPMTGDRGQIMINASWGLGEAVVSGRVSPDQFVLNKADGTAVERAIQMKEIEIRPDPTGRSGTVQLDVEHHRASTAALTDSQLQELGTTCARLEEYYQRPMDIEWAFAGGTLYILQARPVTGL